MPLIQYASRVMAAQTSFICSMFSVPFYPSEFKIYWEFGEAHHFKGPHDRTDATIHYPQSVQIFQFI